MNLLGRKLKFKNSRLTKFHNRKTIETGNFKVGKQLTGAFKAWQYRKVDNEKLKFFKHPND